MGRRQVTSLRLLLADGRAIECSVTQWPELFAAARCGLGCLGIITAVTLQLEPAFRLRESWQTLPLDRVLDDLPALRHSCEHFKFLWYPYTNNAIVISLNRTNDVRPAHTPARLLACPHGACAACLLFFRVHTAHRGAFDHVVPRPRSQPRRTRIAPVPGVVPAEPGADHQSAVLPSAVGRAQRHPSGKQRRGVQL